MDNPAAVLVVDDDVSTQGLLVAVIRRLGLKAKVAGNGREALASIATTFPQAIILDLLMPEVDGFEVLHVLKRDAPQMLKRTIVMTAATGKIVDDCAEIRDVARLMMKPLDIDELGEVVLRCIDGGQKVGRSGAHEAPPRP